MSQAVQWSDGAGLTLLVREGVEAKRHGADVTTVEEDKPPGLLGPE